jgi:hypothetical protein
LICGKTIESTRVQTQTLQVMKNLRNYLALALTLCFTLSNLGNDLYARPGKHPHQQKHPSKSRYYYYPRQNVYYDPSDHVYFVWERNYWKPVPDLPGRYAAISYSSSAPRFELWIASSHPYYYNPEHRRTYYEYRAVRPAPAPPRVHARVENRPKPNVSFHFEINSAPEPQPVYVEERVIVVKEHRGHGHHHGHHGPPGHARGHGKGHGKGRH